MPETDAASGDVNLLVIGYGNELRSDDGVGPKVATAIGAKNLSGVCAISCHQLTPELAEPISKAGTVVFVDAAIGASSEIALRPLAPTEETQVMTHTADPRSLLALARDVFGRCPNAWWLTVPAQNLAFGEELSPVAERGLARAIEEILKLRG